MTASVAAEQRHSKRNPCKICGGYDGQDRGQGKRCGGFLSSDGKYAHCTREELAFGLDVESGGTYAHKLNGDCRCGEQHGPPLDSGETPGTHYDYYDAAGVLSFRVVRKYKNGEKTFRQCKPDGAGGWLWKLNGLPRVLYRLPQLLQADPTETVFLVEGEKDVESAGKLGLLATTSSGGAGGWRKTADNARQVLKGRKVLVIADNDEAGKRYAADVAASLTGAAKAVRWVHCPDGYKDLSDWIAAGATAEQIRELDVAAAPEPDRHASFASVLADWAKEGPLIHQPTGIQSLDKYTNGGIVYGSRAYIMGAPDAGKTAFLVQLAHQYAKLGICVGLLAVDEEPGDVVTRFAQREGWYRSDCEQRDPRVLEHMGEILCVLPVRFYGEEWTIEGAAEDLATWAKECGRRAFFGIDSIQTALSEAAKSAESPRELVNANVRAVRAVTTRHALLTAATCEMNRNAYRSTLSAEMQSDMAAGKESGAIEYSARVLLAMRSVPNEGDLVHCKIVKNKLGQSNVDFHLRLDRRRMLMAECDAPAAEKVDDCDSLKEDCEVLLQLLAQHGFFAGRRGVRELMKLRHVGHTRADLAFASLVDEGEIINSGTQNRPHFISRTAFDALNVPNVPGNVPGT